MRKFLFFFLLLFLSLSCATLYKPSDIENTEFSPSVMDSASIQILHGFTNYLELGGNEKQVKKANKDKLCFLPIRIVNTSANDFILTADKIELFNNFEKTNAVFFTEYYPEIKYKTWSNLAWYFGGLIGSTTISSQGAKFNYLSPALLLFIPGTINIVQANKSNKILKEDLLKLDLLGSTTPAYSESVGFICIHAVEIGEIFIRVKN
jgi:hypothetical protein